MAAIEKRHVLLQSRMKTHKKFLRNLLSGDKAVIAAASPQELNVLRQILREVARGEIPITRADYETFPDSVKETVYRCVKRRPNKTVLEKLSEYYPRILHKIFF